MTFLSAALFLAHPLNLFCRLKSYGRRGVDRKKKLMFGEGEEALSPRDLAELDLTALGAVYGDKPTEAGEKDSEDSRIQKIQKSPKSPKSGSDILAERVGAVPDAERQLQQQDLEQQPEKQSEKQQPEHLQHQEHNEADNNNTDNPLMESQEIGNSARSEETANKLSESTKDSEDNKTDEGDEGLSPRALSKKKDWRKNKRNAQQFPSIFKLGSEMAQSPTKRIPRTARMSLLDFLSELEDENSEWEFTFSLGEGADDIGPSGRSSKMTLEEDLLESIVVCV